MEVFPLVKFIFFCAIMLILKGALNHSSMITTFVNDQQFYLHLRLIAWVTLSKPMELA
jgi:hypothetical protein